MIMLILVSFLIILKSGYAISRYSNSASEILNHKIFDVKKNVRNFIILIPNEAHELPSLPKEQRLINQSYIPEDIELYEGTTVMWLNGDAGHDHKITLVDERSDKIFDSGVIAFGNISKPLVFNNSGEFSYSESNLKTDEFIMWGTISVMENNTEPYFGTNSNLGTNDNKTVDAMGFLKVPTNDLNIHTSNLENNGVDIFDTYTFEDLLVGQKGTGQEQTLLVLGTSNLTNLMKTMMNITDALPYS